MSAEDKRQNFIGVGSRRLIETTKGKMFEAALEKKTGVDENNAEKAEWIEYWLNGELVHRSVNLQLKTPMVFGMGAAGSFK